MSNGMHLNVCVAGEFIYSLRKAISGPIWILPSTQQAAFYILETPSVFVNLHHCFSFTKSCYGRRMNFLF